MITPSTSLIADTGFSSFFADSSQMLNQEGIRWQTSGNEDS
jgi:hypothetical protein